jgi:hypothetical protein
MEPKYVIFLFESDAAKNMSQIIDELLYTLELEDEASTSHRARAEPERRLQLRSRTNDQVGRMVEELCEEIGRHHDSLTQVRWPYDCANCTRLFATKVMLRAHEDLVHKKISVYGIKP